MRESENLEDQRQKEQEDETRGKTVNISFLKPRRMVTIGKKVQHLHLFVLSPSLLSPLVHTIACVLPP